MVLLFSVCNSHRQHQFFLFIRVFIQPHAYFVFKVLFECVFVEMFANGKIKTLKGERERETEQELVRL